MIIFFGTRTSKLGQEKIQDGTQCPNCGNSHSLHAAKYGSYFHVFWIPIVSIGTKRIMDCGHCKSQFELSDAAQATQMPAFARLEETGGKGRWRNFGCLIILAFVAFFIISLIYASIVQAFDSDEGDTPVYEEEFQTTETEVEEDTVYEYVDDRPQWRLLLEKDLRNTDYYPDATKQPKSYAIKSCFDTAMNMSAENTACFIKRYGDNLLVLFEIEEFDRFSDSQKNKVYKTMDQCIGETYSVKDFKVFTGVGTPGEMFMQKSPAGMVKDTTANSSELLKEFYQPLVKK